MIFIGTLIFVLPVLYAPIGYLFLNPAYVAYHTLNLTILLYRSMLILIAVAFLVRDLKFSDQSAVARLMAFQCLLLFSFGALQYLAGIDLVVYERLKDVENVVDVMLSGEEKILFGFGFLGLFRGAVPQMAIIGLFWWLFVSMRKHSGRAEGYSLIAMSLLAAVCVVGSLSRIGVIALIGVLIYGVYVNRRLRFWSGVFLFVGIPILALSPYLDAVQSVGAEMIFGRFDLEQISGQAGSGGIRVESAMRLFDDLQESWLPWVVGLGGFNPISVNDHYGIFGMHGDYMDLVVRYGLLVGIAYIGMVFVLFIKLLGGFFSADPEQRHVPRAFGVLAMGIGILAFTQGALVFSGAAGYLAAAHAWLAIAFCIAVRKNLGSDRGE